MERAFRSPYDLKERLGGTLDAAAIAGLDPDALKDMFSQRPALHRFPGSMAARTQELCRILSETWDNDASRIWTTAKTGDELLGNLRALPGFGEQKSRVFIALLAKRLGVTPPGWETAAGFYAEPGRRSVADVDGPESLAQVRAFKREMKARARS
jgi:uncharacterized HhH-GPD family protein